MSRHQANLGNLTVSSAGSVSTSITAYLDDAIAVTVVGPTTLTATHNIQGSVDGGTTWADIQSGGSDVTIATGANAVTISPFPFNAIRTLCNGGASTEAATRTFVVVKQFEVMR